MKGLLQSKQIWNYFITFLIFFSKEFIRFILTSLGVDQETIDQAMSFDWTTFSSIGVSICMTIGVVLRYYSTKKISGLWQHTKEITDEFDAN